jgi:tRNA nucleotidyltransferase/poly(A) polymerase
LKKFTNALKRMKFSNEEKKLADFILTNRYSLKLNNDSNEINEQNLKPFKDLLVDNVKDANIRLKIDELLKYVDRYEYKQVLDLWQIPLFPITGNMLIERNVKKGPTFSNILNNLKNMWKDDFKYNCDEKTIIELLNKIDSFKC